AEGNRDAVRNLRAEGLLQLAQVCALRADDAAGVGRPQLLEADEALGREIELGEIGPDANGGAHFRLAEDLVPAFSVCVELHDASRADGQNRSLSVVRANRA